MRARLTMKLISILVLLVITVITAHSCSGQPSQSSPLDPATLLQNGLSSLCSSQAVTAEAEGGSAPGTVALPAAQAAMARAAGLPAGSFTCPTTTTTAAPGY